MSTPIVNADAFARTLYGESEPYDTDDARAIACVIMNRVRLPNWPRTIREVCLQPKQFSCWNDNDPQRPRILAVTAKNAWFIECQKIAEAAMHGQFEDFTNGATHYYATYIKAPRWAKGKKPCYVNTYGRYQHLFFNDIDTAPPSSNARKAAKQVLDEQRPLSQTRTVRGGMVSVAGTVGSALAEAAESVRPLAEYADVAKWLFLGLVATGVIVMFWARFSDRNAGER